ncbi:hypothetical protein EXW59_04685 (plasmid) [Bacillus mycoides]|uniref:hypothetical protein n=1 Tax=Bacillus mycoides TaxID=1405 RepID=UPI001C0217DD|nr:hypothetical protein [Bacillus mycoides]QWH76094.1 hypothetical protein EXW59_04685 [Bacillus mycoides]QWI47096.1 hypothetical protein EXW55_29925 [Bacillus mycoides]
MNLEPTIVGMEKSNILFLGSFIIFLSMLILGVIFIKERKWGICFVTFTIGITGLTYCFYPEVTEYLKLISGPIVFGGGD